MPGGDKIFNSLMRTRPKEKVVPQEKIPEVIRPDAVVLVHVKVTCIHCGSIYDTPNRYLMLRFGHDLHCAEGQEGDLFDLPREAFTHKAEAQACNKCFTNTKELPHDTRRQHESTLREAAEGTHERPGSPRRSY